MCGCSTGPVRWAPASRSCSSSQATAPSCHSGDDQIAVPNPWSINSPLAFPASQTRSGRGNHRLAFVLPYTVWMLRGFIASVPADLEEAAMVDGCTRGQAFRKIILPLAAPGLVATAVFAVIQAWNEYLFAYVLLRQNTNQTITVWLDTFTTTKGVDWGALMAASILVAIPIVILFAII